MIAGAPTPQLVEDMVGSQNVSVAAVVHTATKHENVGKRSKLILRVHMSKQR